MITTILSLKTKGEFVQIRLRSPWLIPTSGALKQSPSATRECVKNGYAKG